MERRSQINWDQWAPSSKMIPHRIKLIVGVLAPPAPHVPPVVDEATDVEVRGVNEPVR